MSSAASTPFQLSDVTSVSTSKKDWAWEHCTKPDPRDSNKVKCKYCQHVSNGGIHRFKKHLAGFKGDVASCKKVPEDVKDMVIKSLNEIKGKRTEKPTVKTEKEMLELRGTVRRRDEEDDCDMVEMRGSSSGGPKKPREREPLDKSLGSPLEVATVARQPALRELNEKERHEVFYSMAHWMNDAVNLKSFDVMCEIIRQFKPGFRKPTVYELCELLKKNIEMTGCEYNWSTFEMVREEVECPLAKMGPAKIGGSLTVEVLKVSEEVEHASAKIGPAKIGGSEGETCQVLHNQQVSQNHLAVPDALEQPSVDTGVTHGGCTISAGYNGHKVTGYSNHPQHALSDINMPLENTSFMLHNQHISSTHPTQITRDDSTGPALAQPQEGSLDLQPMGQSIQQSNLSPHGIDDSFLEEEIWMRRNERRENGDMQHLLRILSLGRTSVNFQEDGHGISSYLSSLSTNFNFDEDRSRLSGKAVVGWLKIKAAMRWGIFIRKQVAEKRLVDSWIHDMSHTYMVGG